MSPLTWWRVISVVKGTLPNNDLLQRGRNRGKSTMRTILTSDIERDLGKKKLKFYFH